MKKIISVVVLALILSSAFARDNSSVLNIRVNNNRPFNVMIDGRQVPGASTTVRLNDLSAGNHDLQIFQTVASHGYAHQVRVFANNIVLMGNTEAFATVYPEYGKIKFDRTVAINYAPVRNDLVPRSINPRVIDNNVAHTRPNLNYGGNMYQQPDQCAPVPVAMCDENFCQLQNTIDHATFESTKLTIFKQALAYNYFTTNQVLGLMNQFSFESSKLDVAKQAYTKTIDPNNYYLVDNGFTFSSSIDELGQYVAMR